MHSLPYSFVFLLEWRQVSYLNQFWFIFYLYLQFHVDLSCLRDFHHSTNWFKLVFICRYIYICYIFGHVQICTNHCFLPNSFFEKEYYLLFPCSLARITDEEENPWCISSHGEFLGILIYCITFTLTSPTCLSVSV